MEVTLESSIEQPRVKQQNKPLVYNGAELSTVICNVTGEWGSVRGDYLKLAAKHSFFFFLYAGIFGSELCK